MKKSIPPQQQTDFDQKDLGRFDLEDIVVLTNKIGMQYVSAKKKAEYLDLLKPTKKARIMLKLDEAYPKLTENKKRRMMEADENYIIYLQELSEAKSECDRLRIRYESYKNLFEAKRSKLSFKKAEMKLL